MAEKAIRVKKSILKVLIKQVIIDPQSPKFFSVTVVWKYQEWGTEQVYLVQKGGGRKEWTKREIEILKNVYPGERERLTIMQALPNRSWRAIRTMATSLGLNAGNGQGKGKGIRYQKNQLESLELSWNDILWLQKHELSYKNSFLNGGGWSPQLASAIASIALSGLGGAR